MTNLNQINNKRTLVHFLCDIVYKQQHKSRDSNACLSDRSSQHKKIIDILYSALTLLKHD